MRAFTCVCEQPLFFHNTRCLACGREVAYEPGRKEVAAMEAVGDGTWRVASDDPATASAYRFCEHRAQAAVCNWLVPAAAPVTACLSCRMTRTIPDLQRPRNMDRLGAIEGAKRRVLYGLQLMKLPLVCAEDDPACGLAFDFLEALPEGPPVMTGHSGGLITVNVAEADDDYRERNRDMLREPYRTVIGHLRHELGHYYWDVLVRDSTWLEPFRQVFGDERLDYSQSLQKYYVDGPPLGWPDRYISAYASSHPWEDWAESWAHYLHIRSTLETVRAFGIGTATCPISFAPFEESDLFDAQPGENTKIFLDWVNAWVVLTAVLNETSRSMGQPDLYPFVMNKSVVTKLHFVHRVVQDATGTVSTLAPPPELARAAAP